MELACVDSLPPTPACPVLCRHTTARRLPTDSSVLRIRPVAGPSPSQKYLYRTSQGDAATHVSGAARELLLWMGGPWEVCMQMRDDFVATL